MSYRKATLLGTIIASFTVGILLTPHTSAFAAPSKSNHHALAKLVVELKGLAPNKGPLYLAIIDNVKDWQEVAAPVVMVRARVPTETMRFSFANLPVGKHAIRAYQDEDGNGELNRSAAGIPTERWAFSGQASRLGPTSFEDAAITLLMTGTIVMMALE